MFTARERGVLENLLRVLTGPKRVTQFLQGEFYTTLSFSFPHLHKLWLDMRGFSEQPAFHPGVRRFAQIFQGSLNRRLYQNHLRPSSFIAVFLDPRLKQMTMLPRDARSHAIDYVRTAARHEVNLMERENNSRVAADAAASAALRAAEVAPEAEVAAPEGEAADEADGVGWPSYDHEDAEAGGAGGADDRRDDSHDADINAEFAAYEREPALVDERGPIVEADPLVWWGGRRHQFPIFSRLARRYLAIPASSAAVERMFSYTGAVLSRRSNRLDTTTLLDLMLQRALQKFNERWAPKYLPIARARGLIQ